MIFFPLKLSSHRILSAKQQKLTFKKYIVPLTMLKLWTETIMQVNLLLARKGQFSEMSNTFQWKGRSLYLTLRQYSELACASYCLHITLSETDPSVSFPQARAMYPNAHLWAPERLLFPMMIQVSVANWNTVHLAKYWPSPTTNLSLITFPASFLVVCPQRP